MCCIYLVVKVAAGDPIGEAIASACPSQNHLHMVLTRDGGVVDPSEILDKRPIVTPKWTQDCDDYKLVFKVCETQCRSIKKIRRNLVLIHINR